MRKTILAIFVLTFAFTSGIMYGQGEVSFSSPKKFLTLCKNNPKRLVRVLTTVCSQEQIDQIEAGMNPPPGKVEKYLTIQEMVQKMEKAGYNAGDQFYDNIKQRFEALEKPTDAEFEDYFSNR